MKLERQISYTNHQDIWIGKDLSGALDFATTHFLAICSDSIDTRALCTIALSGGSTPKAIFEKLNAHPDSKGIDWSRVFLFFSDERSIEPTASDSNYHMATTSGIQNLGIPKSQIFRMHAEVDIEKNALEYEKIITSHVPALSFDLVMLGVGEDGHTASLFPNTKGLQEKEKLVIANHIPQKDTWRMTFTFPLINRAKNIAIYALGERKGEIIEEIFIHHKGQNLYPSQCVGTSENKVLWILDSAAATALLNS